MPQDKHILRVCSCKPRWVVRCLSRGAVSRNGGWYELCRHATEEGATAAKERYEEDVWFAGRCRVWHDPDNRTRWYVTYAWDDETGAYGDVRECGCCGRRVTMKPRVRRTVGRTKAQLARIEWLREAILHHAIRYGTAEEDVEYKAWEVRDSDTGRDVFVYAEVGRAANETSYEMIHCRTRRHIVIGVNGGMRLLNAAKQRNGKARKVRGDAVAWEQTE